MKRTIATLSISAALACAPSQRSVSLSPEDDGRSSDGLFRPDKIFAILEGSTRHYEIASADDIEPHEIPEVVRERISPINDLNPFLEVKLDDDGKVRLVVSNPPPEIAEVFSYARQAYADRDYHWAQSLFAKAIEGAPTYFKSYTLIGSVYAELGELELAEAAFVQALKLNPVDYQAHLYLGDAYYQMGELAKSKAHLTRAFMLNRNNESVQERLKAALARLDLRIRTNRLSPRINISRRGDNVKLEFDKASGMRWLALSACLACWAYESECGDRADTDSDPLRLSMYRECLINQAASIAVRMGRDDEVIGPDEQVLLGAIENGYLEAIIFWEIVAQHAPVVILLLPEPVKEQIIDYIDRYVFESTQLI